MFESRTLKTISLLSFVSTAIAVFFGEAQGQVSRIKANNEGQVKTHELIAKFITWVNSFGSQRLAVRKEAMLTKYMDQHKDATQEELEAYSKGIKKTKENRETTLPVMLDILSGKCAPAYTIESQEKLIKLLETVSGPCDRVSDTEFLQIVQALATALTKAENSYITADELPFNAPKQTARQAVKSATAN